MEHQNTNLASSLIRLEEVKQKTGLKRSTIYLYMNENRFPRPVHISSKCVAWVDNEIQDWINEQIKKRKA